MRINESTALVGQDVILVPYRSEHVEKYHEWLKDPDIQQATASEPLTLAEEYDMQRSWHLDDDKLTFIILDRAVHPSLDDLPSRLTQGMIGDVNLFLSDVELDEEDAAVQASPAKQGELEIMIAEPLARRKGLASQAIQLMIAYASRPPLSLAPTHFLVRIGMANKASIAMFDRLGFAVVRTVEVFQEVEMRAKSGGGVQRFVEMAQPELETVAC